MLLGRLNGRLPEAPKVRNPLGRWVPLQSLVEEVGCDGGLSSFLLQEGIKLSKIVACSLEIAPIIRMDVGQKSSSGDELSETGKESFSGSVRYHFQVCSLCAKAHEHSKISFYYGGLMGVSSFDQEGSGIVDPTHGEWGTRSHSGSGELAHHLLFSLGSGLEADDTAPTDSTREAYGA